MLSVRWPLVVRVGRDDAQVAWAFIWAGLLVAMVGVVPLVVGVHDLVLARSLAAHGRSAVATEVSVHTGTDLRGDRSTFLVDGVRGVVPGWGERDIVMGQFSLTRFGRVVEVDPSGQEGWRPPDQGLSVRNPLLVRVDGQGRVMAQAQVDRWMGEPVAAGPVAWAVAGAMFVAVGIWARRRVALLAVDAGSVPDASALSVVGGGSRSANWRTGWVVRRYRG